MTGKVARRLAIAIGVVGGLVALVHHELPALARWKLRRELAAKGFPEARFRVVAVELDRLVLADVELEPGLFLGSVELDAGLSLLWRDAEVVSIRGANVMGMNLERVATRDTPGELSIQVLQIADSVIDLEGHRISIDGSIDLGASTPSSRLTARAASWSLGQTLARDLVVRVDGDRACGAATIEGVPFEACATLVSWRPENLPFTWSAHDSAWNARGHGRLEWSSRLAVRDGFAEITVPAWSRDEVAVDGATIVATFEATTDEVGGRARVRVDRARREAVVIEEAVLEVTGRALATDAWRVELEPIAGTMRALAVRVQDKRLRAETLAFRAARMVITSRMVPSPSVTWTADHLSIGGATFLGAAGSLDGARERGSWTADRVVVAGAALTDAAGTFQAEGALTWRAREVSLAAGKLREASGIVATDGTIRLRAVDFRRGDLLLSRPVIEVSPQHAITWSAEAGVWGELTAQRLTGAISSAGAVFVAAARASWREVEATKLAGAVRQDVVELAWEAGQFGRVAFGHGTLALDPSKRSLRSGAVEAYGGAITLARPAALSARIELRVRGVQLQRILAAVSERSSGWGAFDGMLVLHAGQLERADLRARGAGAFQIGDPSWVDEVVARIAAGEVAVSRRIGGALAAFAYTSLSVALNGSTLHVDVHGTGRRVPQVLDLVINVRGMREAASFLTRAREAS